MADLSTIAKQLEHEMNRKRADIIGLARWLADDLLKMADQLEKQNRDPNSLGVLQGSGVKLDLLCAEYCMAKYHLELVREAIELGFPVAPAEGEQ